MNERTTVDVEIWSDVVCPWCYIGKRRFEAALAAFEHRDSVRVLWRSFELDPLAPAERVGDTATHLAGKYGRSRGEALAMLESVTEVAAAEGLDFRFDRARGGNTLDAHRLLHLASLVERQDELKERLMHAYFTEGEPIGDPTALERIAVASGLPAGEVRDVLATGRFAAEVREDEQAATALGSSAVPFFVLDRGLAVSGAQAPEVLLDLLRRGWSMQPAVASATRGSTYAADTDA